jgi:hypothetical protein
LLSGNIIRLYDRSRVTTDWQCPRKRYWQYEYGGKGVVSGTSALELFMGTVLHDGLAAIARGVEIDLIATEAQKQLYTGLVAQNDGGESDYEVVQFANEQAALVEGLLRGFFRYVWPSLITRYRHIIAIEQEMTYDHAGLRFMSKPDLILGDDEGEWVYVEYKSTSTKKAEWINSWNTAVQLHSSIKAVEQTLGQAPSSVIVQGLYKGYESYGKQNSPFCYAYTRGGNPPFTKPETRYDYAAGFRRNPVWQLEGGVKAWVEAMPDTILAEQFPQTPPIFLNNALIDDFFTQRATREHDIQLAMEVLNTHEQDEVNKGILNTVFPQHFDQCVQGWGRPCGYRQLCFGNVTNPLDAGYQWREPHHLPEVAQWAERTTNEVLVPQAD